MPQLNSWTGRCTIGSGILFTLALVAMPLRYQEPTLAPAVLAPADVDVVATWYVDLCPEAGTMLGDFGDSWEFVGPCELRECSDGSAFLLGTLRDAGGEPATLKLEAELRGANNPRDTRAAKSPFDYERIEGEMRGAGRLEGALLRVTSHAEQQALKLEKDNVKARLAFDVEWLEPPTDSPLDHVGDQAGDRSLQNQFVQLQVELGTDCFSATRQLSLDLGSVDGQYELVAGGNFVERANGSASFDAVVARKGYPNQAFHLELELASQVSESISKRGVPYSTKKREYTSCNGNLWGLDAFKGARLGVQGGGTSYLVSSLREENALEPVLVLALTTNVLQTASGMKQKFHDEDQDGTLSLQLTSRNLQFAHGGIEGGADWRDGFVADLGRMGRDFVFEAGGNFSEWRTGRARLTGLLARRSNPECAFYIDVELENRSLAAGSMSEFWSDESRSSWHGYELTRGKFTGLRKQSGNAFELRSRGTALRVGLGANGVATTYGASGRFDIEVPAEENARETSWMTPDQVELHFDLTRSSEDSAKAVASGVGLQLDSMPNGFAFLAGGRFQQNGDGTARLSGVVERYNFPGQRFFLDLELSGRMGPESPAFPPASGPTVRFGGDGRVGQTPPSVSSWEYFTNFEGTLVGLREFEGARMKLTPRHSCFQIGLGASGEPEAIGGFTTFRVEVEAQPEGRVRIPAGTRAGELSICFERGVQASARESFALPSVGGQSGNALSLPGIAMDFAFLESGKFQEFPGGRACLEGRFVSKSSPELGFDVRIDYGDRVDGDDLAATDLQLPRNAYSDRGGPVNTELWHFYRNAKGILVGTGDLAGSVIEVAAQNRALQVGLGANGRNLEFGASGDLELEALSRPVGSDVWLPDYFPGGEIHIDLPATAWD